MYFRLSPYTLETSFTLSAALTEKHGTTIDATTAAAIIFFILFFLTFV